MISPPDGDRPEAVEPITPHVAGEIRVRSWRRVWVANATGALTCPDGHALKDPLIWEHGCLRCHHKMTRGGAECGRLIYLVGGGLINPRGTSLVILAEIMAAEMRTMMAEKMDAESAMAFLGVSFPG